jgi:predicted amidohydrolase YtcJ
MKKILLSALTVILSFGVGCKSGPDAASSADAIYFGGPIVTVNDAQPSAEAVPIKDGKILAVGARAEIGKDHKGSGTQMVDLGGKTLLPGFLDAHSHFMFALDMPTQANVSAPPVGPVRSIPDIVAALKGIQKRLNIAKGEWIVGWGYDGNELSEGREATRDDLDPAFPDNPVMVIHVSGHGAVLNSAALKKLVLLRRRRRRREG